MKVVASSAINKKYRIYHRYGCKYAPRIKYDNRLEMAEKKDKKRIKKEKPIFHIRSFRKRKPRTKEIFGGIGIITKLNSAGSRV